MTESVQVSIAFLLYIILFGWIGYQRGMWRELVVVIVSIGGFFLLQQAQAYILRFINLAGKFTAFSRAGGLAGNDEAFAALRTAPDWVEPSDGPTVIFLLWAALLLLTYIATSNFITDEKSTSDFTAAILGIVNGLFYITIFLPLLVSFVLPEVLEEGPVSPSSAGVRQLLGSTADALRESFGGFWGTFEAQQPIFVAILLTLLLVAVAATLRRSRA